MACHIITYITVIYLQWFNCSSTDAKAISAWQIYKYGTTSELTLSTTRQLPVIDRPSDVLVKVHAASVNPIDILIMGNYTRLF